MTDGYGQRIDVIQRDLVCNKMYYQGLGESYRRFYSCGLTLRVTVYFDVLGRC